MVSTSDHNRAALGQWLATEQQKSLPNLPSLMGHYGANFDWHYMNAYNSLPTNSTPQNALPGFNCYPQRNNSVANSTHCHQMQSSCTNFAASTQTEPTELDHFKPQDRQRNTCHYTPSVRPLIKVNSSLPPVKPNIIKTFYSGESRITPSVITSNADNGSQKTTNTSYNSGNANNFQKATSASDNSGNVNNFQKATNASYNCVNVNNFQKATSASDNSGNVKNFQKTTNASYNCVNVNNFQKATSASDNSGNVNNFQKTTASYNSVNVNNFQKATSASDKTSSGNVPNFLKATNASDRNNYVHHFQNSINTSYQTSSSNVQMNSSISNEKDSGHVSNLSEINSGGKKTTRKRQHDQNNTRNKTDQGKRKRLKPTDSLASLQLSEKEEIYRLFNITTWYSVPPSSYPNSGLSTINQHLYQHSSTDRSEPQHFIPMKLPIILPNGKRSHPQPVNGNYDSCRINVTFKQTQGNFSQTNNEGLKALLANGSDRNFFSGASIPSLPCNVPAGHVYIDKRPEQQPRSIESSLATTLGVSRNNLVNVPGNNNNTAVDPKVTSKSFNSNYSLQCSTENQNQGNFSQTNNEGLKALLANGSDRNFFSGASIPSLPCNVPAGHVYIDKRPEQQPRSMESSLATTLGVSGNYLVNVSGNNNNTTTLKSLTNNYSLQCSTENQNTSSGIQVLDNFKHGQNEVYNVDSYCTLLTPPITPDNAISSAPPTPPTSTATTVSSTTILSFERSALSSILFEPYTASAISKPFASSAPSAVPKPHASSMSSAEPKPHESSMSSAVSKQLTLSMSPAVSKPHTSSLTFAVSKPHTSSMSSAVSKPYTLSAPSAQFKPHTSSAPPVVSKPHTSTEPTVVFKPHTSSAPSAVSKPHTSSMSSAVAKPHTLSSPAHTSNEANPFNENLTNWKSLEFNEDTNTLNTDKQEPSTAKIFACHICPYQIEKLFNFQLHMAQHYTNREKLIPINVSKHKLRCGICGYFGTDEKDLDAHVGEHVLQKRFVCRYCDIDFNKKGQVRRHIRRTHGEMVVFYDRRKIYKRMVRQAQMMIPINPVVVLGSDEADQYMD